MSERANTIVLVNLLPSVNSTHAIAGSVYPSTAVLLIGTLLKQNGYNVHVIDGGYHKDYLDRLVDYVAAHEADIIWVGMSVMTTQVPLALAAAKAVRQTCPSIRVVWGGPHPTLFPKQTLADPNIDIIVVNEGAITAVKLSHALRGRQSLHAVRGVGYRDEDGQPVITECAEPEDIRALPHFDFSLIDIEQYVQPKRTVSVYQREFPAAGRKVRIAPILTGLGCPYRCQFCINVILKRRYRYRDAESIVAEIKRLQREHGADTFLFLDEDFFVNKRRVLTFLDRVEKENLRFNWRMWCRVDHFSDDYLNRDLVRRLDRIGHGSLVMGGESGNQDVLDRLAKDITPAQTLRSLRTLDGTGIFPRYSFMVGLEGETLDQIRDTYNLCLRMKTMRPETDIAGPFVFRLYPGSPIYDRLVTRHNLAIPTRLEDWREFLIRDEATFSGIPWTPRRFRTQLPRIQYYYDVATRPPREGDRPAGWRGRLATRLAKLRVKHFWYHLPVEYWTDRRLRTAT